MSATDELAAMIRAQIASGELAGGEKLPTIAELRVKGYTKGVAERAMRALRAEGLITARQGSGFYVREPFARIRRESPGRLAKTHWGAGLAIQDHDTGKRDHGVLPEVGDVPAPDYVAEAFGLAPETPVLSRHRLMVVDGRPVQLATSYLPTALTRGTRIEHTDTGPGGIYARLNEQGYGPTHFRESTVGRAPKPDESVQLKLPRNAAWVFEITRLAWSGQRCVEVARMVLAADAYELVYDFSA